MKIIVVGCGKIGFKIATVLSAEKSVHVTVIDKNRDVLNNSPSAIDVIFIEGSGLSEKVLLEAGAKTADLIVCTTHSDEVNILCSIMAKHLGTKHTAARVRDPEYAPELNKLWRNLGIDMVINPEQQTAREISRLLRYPASDDIDTFVGGRVELISFKTGEAPEFFTGKSVSQLFHKKMGVLLAVVERDGKSIIPHGDFVFEESDVLRVMGRPSQIMNFFNNFTKRHKTRDIMIIGGSSITHYLVELLNRHTVKSNIKIIEKDKKKCESLCDALSEVNRRCLFIHGDGTNSDLLQAEEVEKTDAFVCLTDRDEENAIMSLYALRNGVKKVIIKVNHIHQGMIRNLGLSLGNIVTPQNTTANIVSHFVEGLTGVVGNNIRTIHQIFSGENGNVEVIEFHAVKKARCLDIPLKSLKLKAGILLGCIVRNSEIIIPLGETCISPGDSVIVISDNTELRELDDILLNRTNIP